MTDEKLVVDQARMERALQFLADSDLDYARARTLFDGLGEQRKTVKAQCGMRSGETSASAREQAAYTMPDYIAHLGKMEVAELEYLTLQARRHTAAMVIDCWRSLNAARSRGQMM